MKKIQVKLLLLIGTATLAVTSPAYAGEKEVTAVIREIDKIPEEDKPMGQEDEKHVAEVREAYDALPTGDKLLITNYEELEKAEERIANEGLEEPEQEEEKSLAGKVQDAEEEYDKDPYESVTINETNETYGTYYPFELDEEKTTRTIIVHYVTDQDRDGVMEVPELSLTTPDGITTILTQNMAKLKDDTITATVSWQSGYMQLDIEYGTLGKWTVVSSVNVSFEEKEYRGSTQSFDDAEITGKQGNTYIRESGGLVSTEILKSLIPLIAVSIGFIVFIVILNRKPDKSKKKAKEKVKRKRENIDDRIQSHQERDELAELKEEYRKMLRDYNQQEEEEEVREVKKKPRKKRKVVTQEDIDNDVTIAEFEEGNTSVLKKKAKEKAAKKKEPENRENALEEAVSKKAEAKPEAEPESNPAQAESDDDPFGGM